jgi:long-chain acyl-CoA synthetase
MILMPNVPQWVIAFYGVLRAGGSVVSSSPVSPRNEIIREAKESGARILITLTRYADVARAVAAESAVDHVIYTNVKDYLSWWRKLLFGWLREAKEGHRIEGPLREGERLWTDVMRGYHANPVEINIAAENTALIQYTGGTTDHPKGVILSHRALVANALQTRHWVPNLKEGRERVLAVVPFAHVYGMTAAMNVAITLGAAMIILPNFVTQEVLKTIKRQRPTLFPAPTMYVALNSFLACAAITSAASRPVSREQRHCPLKSRRRLKD